MNQAAMVQRAKGPLVWLDMDQKELDDAYDQMVYAPNRDQVHKRNMFNSDRVRARLGAPRRIAYGPTTVEQLDLFAASKPNAPINVFIHGGAWRQRAAKDYAFLAEMFVRAGAHFIALDFVGVENTGGDLQPMADQVRRGVAWAYKNAASFGGDPSRLYVSGQSSGAHLAGCVVTTDWQKDYGVPDDIVKGALLCSGMYDLKPVRLSKRSEYVAFTDEIEEKLSSQRRLDRLNCPLIVSYGTYETPEFQRQNRDFAAAVKAAGKPVTLLVGEGYNHFEMAEMIGNPLSLLGSAVLEQMKLA
jgi:arylformamidase